MNMKRKLPVTVLTGFLGAGKTTLLNRILSEEHNLKIAVIVNEFGEIGIDNQLVIGSDEEIFEMNNGCICCTVRGDLIRIIGELMKRADEFDHLIIETTGLADPAPVIQSFFVDDVMFSTTTLDAIVTVVDAMHIGEHWDSSEAAEQIAFADVVLLNKSDLVTPKALAELKNRIRALNAVTKIVSTNHCDVDLKSVLGVKAFDLQNALKVDAEFLEEEAHVHDESIYSISITANGTVDSTLFNRWLNELVQDRGPDIFRVKGILDMDSQERRFVFQGVHMTLDGQPGKPWLANETRQNELVFIGRNLDEPGLRKGFLDCLLAA